MNSSASMCPKSIRLFLILAVTLLVGCGGGSGGSGGGGASSPSLQSIAITPASPSIAKGSTQNFTATGTYSDSSTKDLTNSVTWTSDNTAVATVAASGLASGVSVGSALITATLGSISGSTTLTVTASYSVGGTATGLSGSGLVLQNNGGDDLAVSANGTFQFVTGVADGGTYAVSVLTDPSSPSQTCSVSNGSGTIAGADVSNVAINCTTNRYSVGGTVSGLSGSGLVLQNNGGDDLAISADGTFQFGTGVADGGTYSVSVLTDPSSPSQTCSVSNGSGTIAGANVSNVAITCTNNSYSVGGTVSGLSGSGLVLQNNAGDDLAVSADGSFTFSTPVTDGTSYAVTVATAPSGPDQACVVQYGTGTISSANVVNVNVSCTTGLYNVVDTGQTTCYNSNTGVSEICTGTGYDADYAGNQPSYTVSADGKVVKDNVTGLLWTQSTDTNGDGVVDYNDKMYLTDAETYCSNLSLDGYQWRLPTIKELYSLIEFTGGDPSGYTGTDTSGLTPFIDNTFDWAFGDQTAGDRIIDGQYASSTKYVSTTFGGSATLFGVNFVDGRIKGYPYDVKEFYVRCVAGNDSYGTNDFVDNGDGTVTDSATGLMWEQDDYHSSDFEDAVAHCESAATGGHTDWRLPNTKELESIIDYTRSPDTTSSAAIDPVFNATSFTNENNATDWGYYWSSTTHATYTGDGSDAAYLSFGRALGYTTAPGGSGPEILDVHGAGAQRADNKVSPSHIPGVSTADVGYGTFYYFGPQGDIRRSDNMARCVRNAN